jgi:hypothetical protein
MRHQGGVFTNGSNTGIPHRFLGALCFFVSDARVSAFFPKEEVNFL